MACEWRVSGVGERGVERAGWRETERQGAAVRDKQTGRGRDWGAMGAGPHLPHPHDDTASAQEGRDAQHTRVLIMLSHAHDFFSGGLDIQMKRRRQVGFRRYTSA